GHYDHATADRPAHSRDELDRAFRLNGVVHADQNLHGLPLSRSASALGGWGNNGTYGAALMVLWYHAAGCHHRWNQGPRGEMRWVCKLDPARGGRDPPPMLRGDSSARARTAAGSGSSWPTIRPSTAAASSD